MLGHGPLARGTGLTCGHLSFRRRFPNRRSFVAVREKVQERGQRRVQQFVVDVGLYTEELPDLPVLKRDLQDQSIPFIGERPDLGIEDWNWRDVERRNEVYAVLNLLLALPAKHHARKTSPSIYRTYVRYCKHPLYRAPI